MSTAVHSPVRHRMITGNGVNTSADIRSDLPGRIIVSGDNTRIVIGENCQALPEMLIHLGPGCSLTIGDGCSLAALQIDAQGGGRVEIGAGTGFVHTTWLKLPEPSAITIGHGCLFATETTVLTSDFHSIVDLETQRRVNHAASVHIAEEVWLGQRATVVKGARIGAQSVVGFGAVVAGEIPPNCVAAGNPARVVRRGIRWHHALVP